MPDFSPVEDEPPLRIWRRFHIVPPGQLGVGRRALLISMVCWLPMVTWALVTGHFLSDPDPEPLLAHFGIHVRCLVAIPLLLMAESWLDRDGRLIGRQLRAARIVTKETRAAFDAVVQDLVRLRNNSLPWVFAIAVAIAWSIASPPEGHTDELNWSVGSDGALGFGGLWFAYVVRPVMIALLAGWMWRLALVSLWMWRLARLPLALVPTHPDRVGGIAVIKLLPRAFAPVTLALSAMMASRWAHDVVYHDALLASFQGPLFGYAVVWTMLLLLPLFLFSRVLRGLRVRSLPQYSVLVGQQGRLVHARWIERQPADESELIEPAGVGPIADAATMYEAVDRIQSVPLGKATLLWILVPLVLPFLVLPLLRFPFAVILKAILKALA